jgi:hypothetical protein
MWPVFHLLVTMNIFMIVQQGKVAQNAVHHVIKHLLETQNMIRDHRETVVFLLVERLSNSRLQWRAAKLVPTLAFGFLESMTATA